MLAVDAQDMTKVYGEGPDAVGLHGVAIQVKPGQVVALLGHNGAGKTTLIRGLATLLQFDSGDVQVAGRDVKDDPRGVRERIALVGQGVAVDDQLTAVQNLVLFGRLRGLDRSTATARARALIADFGLEGDDERPVAGFSGGMRRRLDVAASLIVRPEVLFIDEPTTGLDPAARRDLWRALRVLVGEGTSVLLTTQYLEEADALADHIVLLAHGRTIAEGTPDDLKQLLGRPRMVFRFQTTEEGQTATSSLSVVHPEIGAPDALTLELEATERDSLMTALRVLEDVGVTPIEASLSRPSLDEVFLTLTSDAQARAPRDVQEQNR